MNTFMRRAIDLAVENVRNGGYPFGAVLVKDNQIIAEGVNQQHKVFDVSGHAEIVAIRQAQEKLQTADLSEYTMYASGEPCPMCLTAMYFARVQTVYYCESLEDGDKAGISKPQFIYDELQKSKAERSLKMIHMPLEKDQTAPAKLWNEHHK